jgi:hypothetical protein
MLLGGVLTPFCLREFQSSQGRMAEIIEGLNKVLCKIKPFAELYE